MSKTTSKIFGTIRSIYQDELQQFEVDMLKRESGFPEFVCNALDYLVGLTSKHNYPDFHHVHASITLDQLNECKELTNKMMVSEAGYRYITYEAAMNARYGIYLRTTDDMRDRSINRLKNRIIWLAHLETL